MVNTMEFTQDSRGAIDIMAVKGRIDAVTSPTFDAEMTKWMTAPASTFILDLTGVNFMSSAALRVLLSMAKRASKGKKTLMLAGPTAEIREIFDISNFTSIFKIFGTVEEAVAAAPPAA